MKGRLIFLFLGLVAGSFLSLVALRQSRMLRGIREPEVALQVNRQEVSMDVFHSRLRARHGAQVLSDLVQETLVAQKAGAKKLSLSEKEQDELQKALKPVLDKDLKAAYEAQERTQLLLRKLMLSGVTQQQKQHVYDLFHEDLTQYELFVIVLASQAEAEAVWKSLQEGLLSFDQLVKTYSLDPSNGGRLGYMSISTIRRRLGPGAAEIISAMEPGGVAPPMYCSQGLMVVRLGRKLTTYEQLLPFIENILIESRRVAFTRQLVANARISSPLLDMTKAARDAAMGGKSKDSNESSGQVSPQNHTLPGMKPTAAVPVEGELPKPQPSATSTGVELPRLDPNSALKPKPGLPKPE